MTVGRPKKWVEKLCLEAICQYEAHCEQKEEKATRNGYQDWHKAHDNTPSVIAIEKLGSWNEVRTRAGYSGFRERGHRWTEEECFEAVKQYDKECKDKGEKPLCYGYEAWQKGRNAPSVGTVRSLGFWKELVQRAASTNEQER